MTLRNYLFGSPYVRPEVEEVVASFINDVDDDVLDPVYDELMEIATQFNEDQDETRHRDMDDSQLTTRDKPYRRATVPEVDYRKGYYSELVAEAKICFDTSSHTEADRLVVRRWLGDKMKEHGVRTKHILQHLDLCVELAFIPSNAELYAQEAASSTTARNAYETRRRGFATNTSWWNPFAVRVTYERYRAA